MRLLLLTCLGLAACGSRLALDESSPAADDPGIASMTDDPAAPDQAAELGLVRWGRDHDAAFAAARADGKPVLLLFQEIPG